LNIVVRFIVMPSLPRHLPPLAENYEKVGGSFSQILFKLIKVTGNFKGKATVSAGLPGSEAEMGLAGR